MCSLTKIVEEKFPEAIAFFSPFIHNKIMDRRFNNALSALKTIEGKLAAIGLKVDYQRYFENQLKIPLALINGLSEEEKKEPRELLQNLFMRHLSEKYSDDSYYMTFISIIRTLTPLDVRILKIMWENKNFPLTQYDYEHSAVSEILKVDWADIEISIGNLLRQCLIGRPYSASDIPISGEGRLHFTALGKVFVSACIEELDNYKKVGISQ